MNNNKGSMIILTVIGIATLLIAVIGATFAFFTVTIDYKTEPTEVVVESNKMVIEFMSENSIKYEGAIPGRPEETAKNKLKFSLSSDISMATVTEYDVYLKITKNDFTEVTTGYTNLLYYLDEIEAGKSKPLPGSQINPINSEVGSIYSIYELEDYEFKGIEQKDEDKIIGVKKVGVIPFDAKPSSCPTNGEDMYLSEDGTACMLKISNGAILGNQGAVDNWYFEIWLKEIGENQNYDQGKLFEAEIEIVPKNQTAITNEPDKVKVNP